MSLRSCAYFGCENYSLNGCSHGHYTMFSFPKDTNRFEEWMKLGKVDKRIPVKQLYMCSDHFEQKYISVNSVRTNLLKNSVPIAYVDTCKEDSDEYLESTEIETENKTYEELDIVLENADTTELEELNDISYKINEDYNSYTDSENYSITRLDENASSDEQESLLIEKNISRHSKKRLLNNKNSVVCKRSNSRQSNSTHRHNSNSSSRNRDVHTFIHKGEEYIQMPKEDYLNEKNELLDKLKKYELLFADLKNKLHNF